MCITDIINPGNVPCARIKFDSKFSVILSLTSKIVSLQGLTCRRGRYQVTLDDVAVVLLALGDFFEELIAVQEVFGVLEGIEVVHFGEDEKVVEGLRLLLEDEGVVERESI